MLSVTEDMNNTLVRSSFSTNIKERKDCSVALFDGAGRLVAQGTQIPLHLGSLAGGSRSIFEEGVRIPVTRIMVAGEVATDLLKLIVSNTRDPIERELDLR